MQCFCDVSFFDDIFVIEVCDGSRHLENAVDGARGKHLADAVLFEQAVSALLELTGLFDVLGCDAGIAGRSLESPGLAFSCHEHSLADALG